MILYLDTSSLVKLYVDEVHSAVVFSWFSAAQVVGTSVVAYPEFMSALSRRTRAGDLTAEQRDSLSTRFASQWNQYLLFPVAERVAGGLALEHGLRGFDAVHLAAACAAREQPAGGSLFFSSFDHGLNKAAKAEGLRVLTVE